MTHWLIFLLSFLRLIDQSDYWGRRKLFCKKDNNQFDKRSFGREAGWASSIINLKGVL